MDPPPPVNSWTPRIPGKFWTKKPKNKHKKKSRLFYRRWAWTPPPPSLTKKFWICACIDHSTAHSPGLSCVRRNYMVMCVPWLNYPLTIEALTGGGVGWGAEINLLVPQKSNICFPGFHVPQHFLCLLVPLKSCTYLLCSLEINAPLPCSQNPWKASPTTNLLPTLNPPLALMSSFFLAVPQYSLFLQG